MIKSALASAVSVALLAWSAHALAAETPNPSLTAYVEAVAQTTHGESTSGDVENVLNFYADDIVYEHPAIGIRLAGKDAQRQGMMAFLDTYAGEASDSKIEILDYLKGDGMVALRLQVTFQLKKDDGPETVTRLQTRVVELEEGKIARIIDYW